ncbi:MAG TPA: trehalose-6-phosphate synthase [Gaiellaceae bacterium]
MAAAGRRQLIVVSNRGPASFVRDERGERVTRRGSGGLVNALRGLLSHEEVTWIASAIGDEDRAVAGEAGGDAFDERAGDGSAYRLRLVAHDREAYDRYYNVVANPTLWFVQHYLWALARTPDIDERVMEAWETGYVEVNRAFAAAVLAELDRAPGSVVFFHDYHLYLAPRMVRDARPEARLGHFVHIPWAQPDYWRTLPDSMRRAIHDGLLANDVVGFHARRWRCNFLASAEELVGARPSPELDSVEYGGRRILVTSHPISVDVAGFLRLAGHDAVAAAERELVATRPERLVLRVDRTDPSKNVVRGFRAFGLYLAQHPEAHGRVGMLALLDPSRQDIDEYVEYLEALKAAAAAVNDRFGRDGWLPIDLRIRDDFAETLAAYKQYDVLLVNAVYDGLNLVAKEASLLNERDGVLVLSENAGVHEELAEWALTVNPFDLVGQAAALHEALELPAEERRARIDGIRRRVVEYDVAAWLSDQLADLEAGTG